MGDPVSFDQGANIFGAGTRAEHHAASMKKKTLNPGARERKVVRDWQDDEQDGLLTDRANVGRELGIVRVVVMGSRNQLRNTGCPTGKLKDGRVVGIDVDLGQR